MTAPDVTRLTCTSCAEPAGGGRFCTACGAALQHATASDQDAWTLVPQAAVPSQPSSPPDAVGSVPPALEHHGAPAWAPSGTAPWLTPQPTPPVRHGRRNLLAPLVVCALLVSGWAVVSGVEEHTLTGTVLLESSEHLDLDPGDACFGEDGYDDLNAGAQVVVADEEGTTLATGRLSSGEYDGLGCVFSFELADVARAEFYGLSVAGQNRGELQYSYAELAEDDWSVELSLGDD